MKQPVRRICTRLRRPERRGAAWWTAVLVLKPVLALVRRRDWRDQERIPAKGGVIVAANHISHVDPVLIGEMILSRRRTPAFLAKSSLFERGIVGWWFRSAGHVPVDRVEGGSFAAALAAVRSGRVVVIYPEGSITTREDGWPMAMRSGAARLALASGSPLVPVAQWGAQELLPAYSHRPRLLARPRVTIAVGSPVDLDDLRRDGESQHAVEVASKRLTESIVGGLSRIRER